MKRVEALVSVLGLARLVSCASVENRASDVMGTAQKVPAAPKKGTLAVLHTNDHHGHPLKFYDFPADGQGGLIPRSTYVKEVRSQFENVLLLDAGDITTGRPESMFFDAAADIIGCNHIGYDAVAVGNHAFDKPQSVLKKQMASTRFPFLSANVRYADGSYFAKPHVVKTFKDFTVGVFGLTTSEINDIAGDVAMIKGLVNMGSYATDREGSRRLAAQVAGIDLIIDGHTHTEDVMASGHWDRKAPFVETNTPIVQSQQWGRKVGTPREAHSLAQPRIFVRF